MTAQELKSKVQTSDVIKILQTLGAIISHEDDETIISTTICHNGTSQKLYYYKENKMFHCYTECGSLDIISVVAGNKGFSIPETINWITIQCNIDTNDSGFGQVECIPDWDFINSFRKSKKQLKKESINLPHFDSSILNIFQYWYSKEWLDEGISINSMKKYNIMFCTSQQKIIIPHYDKSNNLIGVRTRAELEDDIKIFGKYNPFQMSGKMYNHPLSNNLYGINRNIETIHKKQKVMLVEGEKGVLQADTMFGDANFTLALCGCSLSTQQLNLLIELGVKEVIIALDKQYSMVNSEEAYRWAEHIKKKLIKPLLPYMSVYIIWDTEGLLDYKQSPTDISKEVLLKLMKQKIYVDSFS